MATSPPAANKPADKFYLGPDCESDLRLQRPYFLVPLLADTPAEEQKGVRERILSWLEKGGKEVTDVCILSHGWHRNFFSATQAYDRIVSALSLLLGRQRLPSPEPFHPLILTLHWHSDPGDDKWEDRSGRRNKSSFLDNVARVFERPAHDATLPADRRFTSVFEDIFQLFATMSVPGPGALTDKETEAEAKRLAPLLQAFPLRDAAGAGDAAKVAAAWTCYDQATPQGVLRDQDEAPGRFLGLRAALWTLATFVVKAVGAITLLGLLFRPEWLVAAWNYFAGQVPWLDSVGRFARAILDWLTVDWYSGLLFGGALFILSYLILKIVRPDPPPGKAAPPSSRLPGRGATFYRVAAWIYLQVICTLPLAAYLFTTYFLGWIAGLGKNRIRGLFDERLGKRNEAISNDQLTMNWWGPRYFLARIAGWPLDLIKRQLTLDSRLLALVEDIDAYRAFWEMQFRGVETGRDAASFLVKLFRSSAEMTTDYLAHARVHLCGHSFGSLVIANAVRHLALDRTLAGNPWSLVKGEGSFLEAPVRKIQTVCLLEGAIACAWFEEEARLLHCVRGALACIYSRYDSANGFYYPVANHGRLAAGFSGLYWQDKNDAPSFLPDNSKPEQVGLFASLTQPPDLLARLDKKPDARSPWIVNLDASRMIYAGSVAAGGGHGDIFKDDVIHLTWAVMFLTA